MKQIITIILTIFWLNSLAPPINKELVELMKIKPIDEFELYKQRLIQAIILQESGGELKINDNEGAYGKLQIRQIYLDEYKRLSHKSYELTDMLIDSCAIEVFTYIMNYYVESYDLDSVCVLHNAGGLTEYDFNITIQYRNEVKEIFNRLEI